MNTATTTDNQVLSAEPIPNLSRNCSYNFMNDLDAAKKLMEEEISSNMSTTPSPIDIDQGEEPQGKLKISIPIPLIIENETKIEEEDWALPPPGPIARCPRSEGKIPRVTVLKNIPNVTIYNSPKIIINNYDYDIIKLNENYSLIDEELEFPPKLEPIKRDSYQFLPWYHTTKESWDDFVNTHGENGIVHTRLGNFTYESWNKEQLNQLY